MSTLRRFTQSAFLAKVTVPWRPASIGALPAIIAFSVLLRLVYLKELSSTPQLPDLDTQLYDTTARNILAGDWLGRR
jgi:hypothetical protein